MYEIWEDTVQPERPQMKIWRMRIEYWISKATNKVKKKKKRKGVPQQAEVVLGVPGS